MNENLDTFEIPSTNTTQKTIMLRVGEVANVQVVPASDPDTLTYRFAGKTISAGTLVLVQVKLIEGGKAKILVNCEKMVIGSMLMKDVKKSLMKV